MRQARIAEGNRLRAEKRFAEVRKLANTLLFDVHDDIRDLPGTTHARQRLVDTAKTYLGSLSADAQEDPLLQRELAAAYERLGDIQGRTLTARYEDSLACYRQALGMRETLFAGRSRLPEDAEAWVRLEFRIGQTLRAMHRFSDAEQSFQVAAGRLQSFESRTKRDLRTHIGGMLVQLSEVQVRLDRDEAARQSIERAITYLEAFGRDHPDDAQAQSELAVAYYVDGEALGHRGEALGALARARQSRALLEELVRREPLKSVFVRRLLFALHAEARHLESLGRLPEALEAHRHCLAVAETVRQRDPQDRFAHLVVASAMSALGRALVAAEQPGAALEPLRSGRRLAQEVVTADSSAGNARNELAVIDSSLAAALTRMPKAGDRAEGCRALADAQGEFAKLAAIGPLTAESRLALRSLEPLKSHCPPPSSP